MLFAMTKQHGAEGAEDDLPVHREAALVDVLDVQVHPLFKAQLVAMRCDLPVAAQAGGHIQPLPLIGGILCDLTGQCRARADDAHFALQHVEELGQLVDAGLAQELAHPGDAGGRSSS